MNPASRLSVDWGELAGLGNGLSQHLRNYCQFLSCIYLIPLAIALKTKTKNKKTRLKSPASTERHSREEMSLDLPVWLELGVLEIRVFASTSEGFCEGNFPYNPDVFAGLDFTLNIIKSLGPRYLHKATGSLEVAFCKLEKDTIFFPPRGAYMIVHSDPNYCSPEQLPVLGH